MSAQPVRHPAIDHSGIGVADVARSAAFYDAALGALGLERVIQLPAESGSDAVGYGEDYPVFWIDRFHPHGVEQHVAFAARTRADVEAFHAAALAAGGSDNGRPGLRDTASGYPSGYYAAFVLDPDGNNIEAVLREGASMWLRSSIGWARRAGAWMAVHEHIVRSDGLRDRHDAHRSRARRCGVTPCTYFDPIDLSWSRCDDARRRCR